MDELWEPPAQQVRFRVVWRGYDRHQVDEYIRAMESSGLTQADSADEGDDSNAPADPADPADLDAQLAAFFAGERRAVMFDVVLRGYDRREVDRYIAQFGR